MTDIPSIDEIRRQAEKALAELEENLADLRSEKERISAQIRAAVAERDEARSLVARLTPRKPRQKKLAAESSNPAAA